MLSVLFNDRHQLRPFLEEVGLCPRVRQNAFGIELLGHVKGFLATHIEPTRSAFLYLFIYLSLLVVLLLILLLYYKYKQQIEYENINNNNNNTKTTQKNLNNKKKNQK